MLSRKKFIGQLGLIASAPSFLNYSSADSTSEIREAIGRLSCDNPVDNATDENFWNTVRKGYQLTKDFINLENGYYLPSPHSVMQAFNEKNIEINSLTSFYMRRKMKDEMKEVHRKLAAFSGVPEDELVITRNATEALDTVILGLDIKPCEEILLAITEYVNMVESWDMKAKRFGIQLNKIVLPLLDGNQAIVDAYRKNITPKTKYILISHVMNMNGQILPVREIADMAREYGIEVICDAAHSFVHIDYKIPDLHVDYFGTSLHKWLSAPLGSGFLQIRKEKINKVWPLFGDNSRAQNDIHKFDQTGTVPSAIYWAIGSAIDFQQAIGVKRKEQRLRYLKNYWTDQVKDIERIKFLTPLNAQQSCAITTFYVEGKDPRHTADYLFDNYKVFTVAYDRSGIKGVRVTPNISNSIEDLDVLVKGLKKYCSI